MTEKILSGVSPSDTNKGNGKIQLESKNAEKHQWFRVQLNTVIREGESLTSDRLRIVPIGTRVRAIQRKGRRVEIDIPLHGWVSWRSDSGDVILRKMHGAEEELATPRDGLSSVDQTQMLRDKIAKFKEEQKRTLQKINEAKEVPEVRAIAEKLDALKKIIRNKSLREKSPMSPKSMKAKLLHTQSCISQLEVENIEKEAEIMQMNEKFTELRTKLSDVCRKRGVDNPEKLSAQIEKMERDQKIACDKILEYETVTKRYETELNEMRKKMTEVLQQGWTDKAQKDQIDIYQGDVVMMKEDIGIVIVHYAGEVHWDSENTYLGVELSSANGTTNGTVDGRKYFSVKPKHGEFYPLSMLERKIPPSFLLKQLQKQVSANQRLLNSKE